MEREISLGPEITQASFYIEARFHVPWCQPTDRRKQQGNFVQQMINYDRESEEAHVRVPQSLADLAPPPS